jgi:hypothetical protein
MLGSSAFEDFMCTKYCEFGFQADSNGRPTCECNEQQPGNNRVSSRSSFELCTLRFVSLSKRELQEHFSVVVCRRASSMSKGHWLIGLMGNDVTIRI